MKLSKPNLIRIFQGVLRVLAFCIFLPLATVAENTNPETCNSYPVIICPSNAYMCSDGYTHPHYTGWAKAEPGSPYCPDTYVYYYDLDWHSNSCYGAPGIKRVWKAKYNSYGYSGMVSECIQYIHIEDHEKPKIKFCPEEDDIHYYGQKAVWKEPKFWDECDDKLHIWSSHKNGSYFPYGHTKVTYYAKDHCGNLAKCSFYVHIQKESTLEIECPDDIVIDCSDHYYPHHLPKPEYNTDCEKCGNHIYGFVYMGSHNGHDYYCSLYKDYWTNAKSKCQSHGGYLAVIDSEEENEFLAGLLTTQTAFIGLSDYQEEGHFSWVNGDPMTYSHWDYGQPNNQYGVQDYAELKNNGYWNDTYYFYKREFILEIPCVEITKTIHSGDYSHFPSGTTKVTYRVEDLCGNVEYCDFYVSKESELKLECPDDIYVESQGEHTHVSWDEPYANSCCDQCQHHHSASASDYFHGYDYLGTHDGHKYFLSTWADYWYNAKHHAADKGGYLASINDAEENYYLKSKIDNYSVFIGLSDHSHEGVFKWHSGESVGYTNWASGQPNNYNGAQDFVEMKHDGKWNDQYNYKKLKYIIEIPVCIDIEQVEGPENGSYFSAGSTKITYKASDSCGNMEYCSFYVHVGDQQDYCESSSHHSDKAWIQKVQFGGIHNVSGNNGGYAYFDDDCPVFQNGKYYLMKLYPGLQYGYHEKLYWKIYADWNGSGDFDDPGEFLGYGASYGGLSGYIKIPTNATPGMTRLRIIMSAKELPYGSCGDYYFGETEDYCIELTGSGTITNDVSNKSNYSDLKQEAIEFVAITDSSEIPDNTQSNEVYEPVAYPNPASYELTVGDLGPNVRSIQVFDLSGKKLNTIDVIDSAKTVKVDVSHLNSGLYILVIRDDEGHQKLLRINVQQ